MAPPPPVLVTEAVLLKKTVLATLSELALKMAPPAPRMLIGTRLACAGPRGDDPARLAKNDRAWPDWETQPPEKAPFWVKLEPLTVAVSLVDSAPPAPEVQFSTNASLTSESVPGVSTVPTGGRWP